MIRGLSLDLIQGGGGQELRLPQWLPPLAWLPEDIEKKKIENQKDWIEKKIIKIMKIGKQGDQPKKEFQIEKLIEAREEGMGDNKKTSPAN